MSMPPFIVIRLQPGWALGADAASLVHRGRSTALDLPSGAWLAPALDVPPPEHGQRTPAEHEIARYLHLHLPAGLGGEDMLARVATWPGVGRVTLPPGFTP